MGGGFDDIGNIQNMFHMMFRLFFLLVVVFYANQLKSDHLPSFVFPHNMLDRNFVMLDLHLHK